MSLFIFLQQEGYSSLADATSLTEDLFSFGVKKNEAPSDNHPGREVCKKDYINRINYANFEKIPLTVVFRHKVFGRSIAMKAQSEPCFSNELLLKWQEVPGDSENLDNFILDEILIPGFDNSLSISPESYNLLSDGVSLILPDFAIELQRRLTVREKCQNIDVLIIQNGTMYSGYLKNFHSSGFLVSVEKNCNPSMKLLNMEENVSLLIKKEKEMVFSGICSVFNPRECSGAVEFVLKPNSESFKRFKGKDFRGERYDMHASIQLQFDHPLSGSIKHMLVKDISGSGLSVKERVEKTVLFAGLIIPECRIVLPGNNSLVCKVQVVYSGKAVEDDPDHVIAGLAILDMKPAAYTRLLDYIHHELDNRSNICNTVDTDALWKFFFESGFIYPEKYQYLLNDIEQIKTLYNKLYTEMPAIARHFIYQKDNHIQGHMSMLRSYERSWLLHHHAASSINGASSGLHVLNQVGSFTNNCHHIDSMHLDYLMCYFRRENKFPNKMFGGLALGINDRSKCSLDDWGYFHMDQEPELDFTNTADWECIKSTEGDLKDLQSFYEERDGGLMLKSFNVVDGSFDSRSLIDDYGESGFSRDLSFFSLRKHGLTRAIIMIDQTNAGLNMSDLTNSFKLFLFDPEELSRPIVEWALRSLAEYYPSSEKISALAYPMDTAQRIELPIDKVYTMWVLNVEAGDSYFHHLRKLIRKIHH